MAAVNALEVEDLERAIQGADWPQHAGVLILRIWRDDPTLDLLYSKEPR